MGQIYTFVRKLHICPICPILELPTPHELRLHVVEGYPSQCSSGLFLFIPYWLPVCSLRCWRPRQQQATERNARLENNLTQGLGNQNKCLGFRSTVVVGEDANNGKSGVF